MKKLHLLGHVFQVDNRGYEFFTRYLDNIERYAKTHNISKDILDDIKYGIVEKLYTYETPITENQLVHIANDMWDPRDIFNDIDFVQSDDNKTVGDFEKKTKTFFGRNSPMIWWVCYRLSKTLNINVTLVRIIFLLLVFFYGMTIRLYPILALFVPYEKKSQTTGKIGQFLYHIIRTILLLGVIIVLGILFLWSLIIFWFIIFTPDINNQSLGMIIPNYMYGIGIWVILSLLVLLIWALWTLLKTNWINKTHALIASFILFFCLIVFGGTLYKMYLTTMDNGLYKLSSSTPIWPTTSSGDKITIHIDTDNSGWIIKYPVLDVLNSSQLYMYLSPSSWDSILVDSVAKIYAINNNHTQLLHQKIVPISITWDNKNIYIILPHKTFSEKVPFGIVIRDINFQVPKWVEVVLENNTSSRFVIPHRFSIDDDSWKGRVVCDDDNSYVYDPSLDAFRCKNFTYEKLWRNKL